MFGNIRFPKGIKFDKNQMNSSGILNGRPNLGWVRFIDSAENVHDSREYGYLANTPRVCWSPQTINTANVHGRSEPLVMVTDQRKPKTITISIGVTDERIAENVLRNFCGSGKLVISTHPDLYYNVTTCDIVQSEPASGTSRYFSIIEITYTASVYRYLLNEKIIKSPEFNADSGRSWEFILPYPFSDETSEPCIYFLQNKGVHGNSMQVIFVDGKSFLVHGLTAKSVYCIDSQRKIFFRAGRIHSDGGFEKVQPKEDQTYLVSGEFPILSAGRKHTVSWSAQESETITRICIKPNRRWNI